MAAQHPDFDVFPMRYAEALLTLAEADARQNGGVTTATGTNYINMVRTRANATTLASYTLDSILDEWTREFFMEGRHRTDLIRFGLYGGTTNYQWRWKGGTYAGINFPAERNIFPLPQQVLEQNANATQAPGY